MSMLSKGPLEPHTIDPHSEPVETQGAKVSPPVLDSTGYYASLDEAAVRNERRRVFLDQLRDHTPFRDRRDSINDTISVGNPVVTTQAGLALSEELAPPPYTQSPLDSTNVQPFRIGHSPTRSVSNTAARLKAQYDDVVKPTSGSRAWLWQDSAYTQWRQHLRQHLLGNDKILVVVGGLSTGKTVITKLLSQRLEEEGHICVPFLCKAEVEGRRSPYSIIATFVYHLVLTSDLALSHVPEERLANAASLPFEHLWQLFVSITVEAAFSDYVFIVDALDACEPAAVRALQLAARETKSVLQASMVFTTRPVNHTQAFQTQHPCIQVNVKDVANDAAVILDDLLRSRNFHQTHTDDLVLQIRDRILTGTRSMLLALDSTLRKFDAAQLVSGVNHGQAYLADLFDSIPEEVHDYYIHEMTPQVERHARHLDEMARVLNILLAVQQHSLSESEFRTAYILSDPLITKRGRDILRTISAIDPVSRAQALCGPLLSVQPATKTHWRRISIAQPTTKTFLLQAGDSLSGDPVIRFLAELRLKSGHQLLLRACLSYLNRLSDPDLAGDVTLAAGRSREESFWFYSTRHWPIHARGSLSNVDEHLDLLKMLFEFLSPDSSAYRRWCNEVRLSRKTFGSIVPWWERPIPIGVTLVRETLNSIITVVTERASLDDNDLLGGLDHVNFEEVDDFGRTPLLIALKHDDLEIAHTLLDYGVSVNTPDGNGVTALHLAVITGRADLVKRIATSTVNMDVPGKLKGDDPTHTPLSLSMSASVEISKQLLQAGAKSYVRAVDNWSLLHEVAHLNRLDQLQVVLQLGMAVDIQSRAGFTPLMIAARQPSGLAIVKTLVERHSANVNVYAELGSTALYEAAYYGNAGIAAYLLKKHANPDRGRRGWSPLVAAAYAGHSYHVTVAKLLLDAGADIESPTPDGDTPLIVAVRQKATAMVHLLVSRKADPTARNKLGQSSIFLAASQGDPNILRKLLVNVSNPDGESRVCQKGKAQDPDGSWSCLHAAAYGGHYDVVKQLITVRGRSPYVDETYERQQWSPLLAALYRNRVEVAKYLLAHGADPCKKSIKDWNALHMACFYTKDVGIVEQILLKMSNITGNEHVDILCEVTAKGSMALSLAAEKGFSDAVRMLVKEYKAPTLVRNHLESTPLFYAANVGSDASVRCLLSVAFLADMRNDFGWTALHAACKNCSRDTVEKLLDVTSLTDSYEPGFRPLHIAVQNANAPAVAALLQRGVDIDAASAWGSTPIFVAAMWGKQAFVDLLLAKGARLDLYDWRNNLPLNAAYFNGSGFKLLSLRPPTGFRPRVSVNFLDTLVHGAARVSVQEVSWALEQGCPSSSRNAYHQTPLSIACEEGTTDVVRLFLGRSNAWEQDVPCLLTGWTPLHLAARLRHHACIAAFADNPGVDPQATDCFGMSAYDYTYGDVRSWLALIAAFPYSTPVLRRASLSGTEQKTLDKTVICEICDWATRRIDQGPKQFTDADVHLASYVLIDAFLRLGDITNARTALDVVLRQPSLRSGTNVSCANCHQRPLDQAFVCTICPFRCLCKDCKELCEKEGVAGCFQHSFLAVPSESRIRDDHEAEQIDMSEHAWLESVRRAYDDGTIGSEKLTLHIWESESLRTGDELFADICLEPNGSHAVDLSTVLGHLKQYPRDIAVADRNGRNLAMYIIDLAKTDRCCLAALEVITENGARLHAYDFAGDSTIDHACQKDFGDSLALILEQWDPDFDGLRPAKPASSAINTMIERSWDLAIELAFRRHYEWATHGDYSTFKQLTTIGLDAIRNVAELHAIMSENVDDVDKLSVESEPRIPSAHSSFNEEPHEVAHMPGCIHTQMASMSSPQSRKSSVAASWARGMGPSMRYDIFGHPGGRRKLADKGHRSREDVSRSRDDDEANDTDDGSFGPIPEEELSAEAARQPETPEPVSSTSAYASSDLAIKSCGIGGLFADSPIQPDFGKTVKGFQQISVSYPGSEESALLTILRRASEGFLRAVRYAQDAGLCCSTFSIVRTTQATFDPGHPVVALALISLTSALEFAQTLKAQRDLSDELSKLVDPCQQLLHAFGIKLELDEIARHMTHYLSLTVQLLCWGFSSFVNGHLSTFQSIWTAFEVGRIDMRGAGDTTCRAVSIIPVTMSCLGSMLPASLLAVLCRQDHVYQSDGEAAGAYLEARAVDFMELWGPIAYEESENDGVSNERRLTYLHVRGGSLHIQGKTQTGSKLAHWASATEMITQRQMIQPSLSFSPSDTLLVGHLKFNGSHPNGPCHLDTRRAWEENFTRLVELDTRNPAYETNSRSTQLGVAPSYINANVSIAQQLNRGHTEKDRRIAEFSDSACNVNLLNRPHGVILSLCSGSAERVPLRIVLAEVLFEFYDGGFFTPVRGPEGTVLSARTEQRVLDQLYKKLNGSGCDNELAANQAFKVYYSTMYQYYQSTFAYVKRAILCMLNYLRHSGYQGIRNVFRVSWAHEYGPTKCFELDCSGSQFSWLKKMLKDTAELATFAVASKHCLVVHRSTRTHWGGPGIQCRNLAIGLPRQDLMSSTMHVLHTKILGEVRENVFYALQRSGRQPRFATAVGLKIDRHHMIKLLLLIDRLYVFFRNGMREVIPIHESADVLFPLLRFEETNVSTSSRWPHLLP